MQKVASVIFIFVFSILSWASSAESLFDFKVKTIDGKHFSLDQFKGKKKAFLIVNTASQCGYTGQYSGLQKVYSKNKGNGLIVLGFPSNDFGGQEPEGNKKIKKFCELKYGVKFPLFEKGPVTGDGAQKLFKWLTTTGGPVKWNFEKFLVGSDGQLIRRFKSAVTPESDDLQKAIKTALGS